MRDLRYFTVLAEHLHFTAAAEKLYISQPALSKQIRALERQLGFPLLERRPREVVLTPQGQALLPKARELVAAWQEAWREARAAGPAFSLTVGMQTAVGRDLQREALARFRDRGWRISLRLVSWEDPTAGLGDGGSDVAFLWLPLPAPGLVSRTLVREPRYVALPADHRLAARTEVDFAELADEAFVALPRAAGPVRDFWLATDAREGREPRIGTEVTSPADTFEAVASGLGVVLLAEGNAGLYPRPDVVHRPVRDLAPAELALVWRANDTRPEVAEFVAAFTPLPPAESDSGGPKAWAGT
ncbi:LysR substrate-binding domain-containing protein [Streptomyces sp. NPDC050619]|uniref:LysR family transcriptional regulator n=1 Tax=Streptomyces sp. NPDC050619 TaxID=3157214 RepID=UPI003441BE6D